MAQGTDHSERRHRRKLSTKEVESSGSHRLSPRFLKDIKQEMPGIQENFPHSSFLSLGVLRSVLRKKLFF